VEDTPPEGERERSIFELDPTPRIRWGLSPTELTDRALAARAAAAAEAEDAVEAAASSTSGCTPHPDDTFEPPNSPDCVPVFVSAFSPDDWGAGHDIPTTKSSCDRKPCLSLYADKLKVVNCNAGMEDLYRTAWCMLLENWDIVEWIFWMTFFDTECIENVLNFKSMGFYVACSKEEGPEPYTCVEGDFTAHSYEWPIPDIEGFGVAGEGWITLCMEEPENKAALRAWLHGSDADRICASIEIGVWLLHELTHICLLNYDQDEDACEYSYTTGNSYRWAMLQRYPEAESSDCCVEWAGTAARDALFMSPHGDGFSGSCA
jgi:hypothetical protein